MVKLGPQRSELEHMWGQSWNIYDYRVRAASFRCWCIISKTCVTASCVMQTGEVQSGQHEVQFSWRVVKYCHFIQPSPWSKMVEMMCTEFSAVKMIAQKMRGQGGSYGELEVTIGVDATGLMVVALVTRVTKSYTLLFDSHISVSHRH